jgi:hypothetical protein
MAEYYHLIARSVAELPRNTEQTRQELYEQARAALVKRLGALDPPVSDRERMTERLALEETFRKVEALIARASERKLSAVELLHHESIAAALGGLAGTLAQASGGALIELAHDRVFRFGPTGTQADRTTASDRAADWRLSESRARMRDLSNRATHLLDQKSWRGLALTAGLLNALLELPAVEIAEKIGTLWVFTACLGAYIERSKDARSSSTGEIAPLPADLLYCLSEAVFAVGPWVRRFPSGRALDEAAREFAFGRGELGRAAEFLECTQNAGLLDEDHGQVIWIAIEAGRDQSIPAAKARGWAIETVRNIAIAMLEELRQMAEGRAAGNAAQSARYAGIGERIEEVIRTGKDALLQLVYPLSARIGAAVETALAQLEQAGKLPVA